MDAAGLITPLAGDGTWDFDRTHAWALTESLPPDTALAFLVVEHRWAQPLFDAIAETGAGFSARAFLRPRPGWSSGPR